MKRLNEENNGKAAELFEMLQRHQAFMGGIVEDTAKLMVELDMDSIWMLTQILRQ